MGQWTRPLGYCDNLQMSNFLKCFELCVVLFDIQDFREFIGYLRFKLSNKLVRGLDSCAQDWTKPKYHLSICGTYLQDLCFLEKGYVAICLTKEV